MSLATQDLWTLTWARPHVDAQALAAAVQVEAARDDLDFRTRLLIRDSVNALKQFWGAQRLRSWLEASPQRTAIQRILDSDLGPPGFPSLASRLMKPVEPKAVLQLFRDIGESLQRRTRIAIGGSISLILAGHLSRSTEDLDIVDELPPEIRNRHELLADIAKRFGLHLAHFQSHFLPAGWDKRLRSFGVFGQLEVHLVDPSDVFLSKLFSSREKDLDDLRIVEPQFDKQTLSQRLPLSCASLLAEPDLRKNAERNWYILFGDPLPAPPA